MAGNSGGPWGGGGNDGDDQGEDDRKKRPNGGRENGGNEPQIPEIDELVKKGQEQLRVLMGGRGKGSGNGGGNGRGQGPVGPGLNRGTVGLGLLVVFGLWLFQSFYTVKPEEQSVELFLGECNSPCIGTPGLNFAPWPIVTYEIIPVTRETIEDIGGGTGSEAGLMQTGDENIVDIDFQVVWNINNAEEYLFNLRDPKATIRAVSESAMREIIAQSELAPILNRDRGSIEAQLETLIQSTLDSYRSGVTIVRANFDKADPPAEVIASFFAVQSAAQERDKLEKQADAYANKVLAAARGESAQVLEEAEGYRARVVNEAEGEASRFTAVLSEYQKAPQVTRKRLYLEMMEDVLGDVDKIILGGDESQGIVPYLPLNELRKNQAGGNN
ncbi:FtsH protease activity modulator HflK [Lentibacter algarum]|uniref:FtsH protease activity modulator HflK n=1 Tax=Lentibacter algarum TaxID=576131 RepID=UPI001C0784BC|nr:FtsH protease activity modulator HflK [Lentibacter algarum]MBU2980843.1 FtsH protease activity modulator HflK [Lentibacter algarum]